MHPTFLLSLALFTIFGAGLFIVLGTIGNWSLLAPYTHMARKSNPLFRPLPTGAFYYVQLVVGFLFMLWPLGFVWWSYTRGFF